MARKLLVVIVVLVGCGSVSGIASADTTPLYYDGYGNLLASPDPFGNAAHGVGNTGTGSAALRSTAGSIFSGEGSSNTADGYHTLARDSSGSSNTAVGNGAMFNDMTGGLNTATGAFALESNASGDSNVGDGDHALYENVSGSQNTATGANALGSATSSDNVADGFDALAALTSGQRDVAMGSSAARTMTTGNYNLADGDHALYHDKSGSTNTGTGYAALYHLSGSGNTGLGFHAGYNLTSGHDDIDVANAGVSQESGTTRIGTVGTQTKAFLAGVNGVAIRGPVKTVVVNAQGQLGTAVASGGTARPQAHAAAARTWSRSSAVHRLKSHLHHQQHQIDQLAAEVHALQAH